MLDSNKFITEEPVKVSIIMLTYNREKLIMKSIMSVLHQSFDDYELLIIDDGSTDETAKLVKQLTDSRIKYFHFQHTGRVAQLRNIGIENAKGEYIAFIDSDDLWEKNKLSEQVTILSQHPNVGITFSDVYLFTSKRISQNGIYNVFKNKYSASDYFYQGNIFNLLISNDIAIYPSSVLFRRHCLDKVGLLEELFKLGETNFFIRICYYYNAYMAFYCWTGIRKHEGNVSSDFHKSGFEEMIATISSFYKFGSIDSKTYKKSFVRLKYSMAINYWKKDDIMHCRQELISCLKINPFYFKAIIRYIWSYLV